MIKLVTEQMVDCIPNNFTGIASYEDGSVIYYKNGLSHREDGPAIICSDGYQKWCLEGKPHNLNGPAVIYPNGAEIYCLHGQKYYIKENWEKEVAKLKNPYYDKIIEIDGKKYKLTLIEE
ncbi:MAG: hypothetical protein RL621_312 [Bacteroidota bacterium]|jgi:hypothetical protein